MTMRNTLLWLVALFLLAGCGVRYYPTPPTPPSEEEVIAANGAEDSVVGSGGVNAPEHLDKPHVILISFDGFRADYLDRVEAPNFERVAREGVRAEGLISVFPSKTFPAHYSIATGMYPDAHGIVSNRFYDPERDATYSIGDRESVMDGTWYRGEPIWVTAEKQGMVAASYFWVGSEADVQGIRPTIWKEFDGRVPNEARVDSVLAWLQLPVERRPHMITLYFSDVDGAGHRHGPDAPEVDEAILRVDAALGRLLDGLDGLPAVRDRVYTILVSDHGMAEYWTESAVAIDDIIDMTGIRMPDSGPVAQLHVEGGPARAREVRDALNAGIEHGEAFLRHEVPAHLHYREDPRIGDVVVRMAEHWQIRLRDRLPTSGGGTHGWDPTIPSMHGIFLASGPRIRQGTRIPAFEMVDIYPFIAEVLGLRPGPEVQGSPAHLPKLILEY
jgi:predicted AlkP superfamily pyrophosphatase or phosphodiesterase